MAQPVEPPELPNAPYPAPPPFWKHFTSTNQQAYEDLIPNTTNSKLETIPYPLTLFRPPPPPSKDADATYTIFNTIHHVRPKPRLPEPDRLLFNPDTVLSGNSTNIINIQKLLNRLLKSLMLNFLELTTIMADDPRAWAEKMDDIRLLFENMTGAVNLLRAHQGREGVRRMLEKRVKKEKEDIEKMKEMKKDIESFLGGLTKEADEEEDMDVDTMPEKQQAHNIQHVEVSDVRQEHEQRQEIEKARRLWEMLDEIGDED